MQNSTDIDKTTQDNTQGPGNETKSLARTLVEALVILLIPLILALIYNISSPNGIPILPKKITLDAGKAVSNTAAPGEGHDRAR